MDEQATLTPMTWSRFKTTRWSLLGLVRHQRHSDEVMETLSRIYYPAIYAYLRRSGIGAERAEELAQGFFAEIVVGRRLFEKVECKRGRARDYLLSALNNYQRDRHRREVVRGKGRLLSGNALQREEAFVAAEGDEDPASVFDRRLATATLEEALDRCEKHYADRGMHAHWAAFEARELSPALHGVKALPLATLAEELGFRTPADAAAAVQTVKRRAALLVREVLVETSPPGTDIDAAHQAFLTALTA